MVTKTRYSNESIIISSSINADKRVFGTENFVLKKVRSWQNFLVRKYSWFWKIAVVVIVADQLSKFFIDYVQPQSSFIHLVQNTGAGFGILKGQTLWLALISFIVAVVVIINYKKLPPALFPQVLWGLFLGGVIGNLIDRALRGYVIDFIDMQIWPTFNVADAAITASVIGLVVYYWKE